MIHSIITTFSFEKILTVTIALVWFINGLFCKVLNWVPRHQFIVAKILGESYAILFTRTIGFLEVLMAVWIISRIEIKLCTILQMIVVVMMNLIEFIKVPHLLLFGRVNIIVAMVFITIVYYDGFVLPHFVSNSY